MTDPTSKAGTPAPSRLPFSAALTTVGNVAAILAAVVLAILIAARFGTSAKTDGYFAALSLYALTGVLAQSWRTTIVARLGESDAPFGAFERYFGAVAFVFVLSGIAFVALSGPVASALTGTLPAVAQKTAHTTLLVLWPAVGGQLLAGLAAAMLAVLGNYTQAAIAYPAGNFLTVIALVTLEPALGIYALPVGVLAGSVVTALILTTALVRRGWRPSLTLVREGRVKVDAAWTLIYSSLSVLVLQIVHVISISAASRVGEGAVTVWSYAFTGHGMVKVLTTLSLPIVIAAPIAATWDRRPSTLRAYDDDVMRTTMVLLLPAMAAAVLVGEDVGRALLPKFSADDIHQIVVTFLILAGAIVASQAITVANIALLTIGRYGAMALISIPVLIFQLGLTVAAVAIGNLAAVAVALVATYAFRGACFIWLVHGRGSFRVLARLMGEVLRIALPGCGCFGLAALLFRGVGGPVGDAAALALGLALYAGAIALFMPAYRLLATRLLRSVRPAPAG